MKKLLFTLFITFIYGNVMYAKYPEKGYRGFVEWNIEPGSYKSYRETENSAYLEKYTAYYLLYGISTSHGYQFNPHFFLGAGIWLQWGTGELYGPNLEMPVFLHGRTDWTFGKFPLFFDLRLGVSRGGRYLNAVQDKVFIIPSVGYQLALGRTISANFSVGLSLHGGHLTDNTTFIPLPSIRLGIEF